VDYVVNFRGYPACPCLAAWLPVYEAELQRRGLLVGPLRIYQLIGGAAASGGTHATGGAFDLLDLPGAEDQWVARQMGADATWARLYNWDGRGGMAHTHGVLTGCPHNGPARYQIDAVQDGFNGLGAGGRGAPDPGPRPLSGRTWQQGIEWARQLQEEHEMTPDQADLLKQIAADTKALRKNTAKVREKLARLIKKGSATRDDLADVLTALEED
jgi:hypothetical protein